LYFLVVFATYFTNALIWVFGKAQLSEIPVGFAVAMASVMSQRLIFNIRDNYNRDDTGMSTTGRSYSDHRYAISDVAFKRFPIPKRRLENGININDTYYSSETRTSASAIETRSGATEDFLGDREEMREMQTMASTA